MGNADGREQAVEIAALIDELSKAAAYPHPVEGVAVHQTHISVVFLAGAFAYKVKKSVNLGFLDFSTLECRRHFCAEEVRLNRRLAADVYFGVVPVSNWAKGLVFEGRGELGDGDGDGEDRHLVVVRRSRLLGRSDDY